MFTRSFEAAAETAEVAARQAERLALIQLGAALEARDSVLKTMRKFSDPRKRTTEFRRFERRGESALQRSRRRAEREAREVQREMKQARGQLEGQLEELRTGAGQVAGRINGAL